MALTIDAAAAGDTPDAPVPGAIGSLRVFVFALFFIFGGITSLNDVLIPKLRGLFQLGQGEVMLVQTAYFAAYFIFSFPAAALIRRAGQLQAATIGLLVMAAGCLLFVPATLAGAFGLFLPALFVLAAGVTVVQVVANPLISALGPRGTASSRLTFAQAFNSLGTTVFPYVGAILILGGLAEVDPARLSGDALAAFRAREGATIGHAYVGIAVALLLVAAVVWSRRRALPHRPGAGGASLRGALDLLRRRRFAFGTLGIFVYVGAEVSIGSLIVSYLLGLSSLGLDEAAAGRHVAFYWGGAMVGRFLGAGLLRLFRPGLVLAAAAAVAILLLATSGTSAGSVAMWSLLAIGLFNSIMFPTIFSLASDGLGARAAEGSGLICMAIVGGAIVPPITGLVADAAGLRLALAVPALCYAVILAFGLFCGRRADA